jgi:hypothetical protein
MPWKEKIWKIWWREREKGVDEEERRRRNIWPSLERESEKIVKIFWPQNN